MTASVFMGGVNVFDALVYGQQHPATAAYLEENTNRFAGYINQFGATLTDAAQMFYQRGQELYHQFNNSAAIRAAEAAVRKVKAFFQPEVIKPLWELPELQNASLTMQRWVMACPEVRSLYHAQRLDGYSDTYIDMHPGVIGEQHYDYRRAMHGLLVEDEEHDFKVSFYLDELAEGDRALTLSEQVDIQDSWQSLLWYMREGTDDPTSAHGGKL